MSGKPGLSGNRTGKRGSYPPRKVVIPLDIAKDLRRIAPDAQLQQLVESLLVKFLIEITEQQKTETLPQRIGEKETNKMTRTEALAQIEHYTNNGKAVFYEPSANGWLRVWQLGPLPYGITNSVAFVRTVDEAEAIGALFNDFRGKRIDDGDFWE